MNRHSTAYGLAIAIFILDQLAKLTMIYPLALKQVGQITLLPIFNFTWIENRGFSLGLAQAQTDLQRWGLVALTSIIAIIVAWWIKREEKGGERIALALVLGGALGNIVDRVRLGFVVDFLDLHFGEWRPFLVFNVADAAISIGVVILLLRAIFVRPAAPEEKIDHA